MFITLNVYNVEVTDKMTAEDRGRWSAIVSIDFGDKRREEEEGNV